MLIACPDCRRQYDVGDFAPGSRVRCACGAVCTVPERAPRQAEVLHCADCGGRLRSVHERCEYCGAEVAPAERALGETCPECFARMPKGARHCAHCGVRIAPVAALRAAPDRRCPRCDVELAVRDHSVGPLHECRRCAGVWLEREVFERFLAQRKAEARLRPGRPVVSRRPAGSRPTRSRLPESPPVRCPACGATMAYREFAPGSKLYVDACYPHGWWFDEGELEGLAEFVRTGGLRSARARQRADTLRRHRLARREAGRREGGDWALTLLDLLGMAFDD